MYNNDNPGLSIISLVGLLVLAVFAFCISKPANGAVFTDFNQTLIGSKDPENPEHLSSRLYVKDRERTPLLQAWYVMSNEYVEITGIGYEEIGPRDTNTFNMRYIIQGTIRPEGDAYRWPERTSLPYYYNGELISAFNTSHIANTFSMNTALWFGFSSFRPTPVWLTFDEWNEVVPIGDPADDLYGIERRFTISASFRFTQIPTPSAFGAGMLGLIGIASRRRRRA